MKLYYKLTDEKDQTYGGCQWGEGITNKAKRGRGRLCSPFYIHATTHPLLAVLLNPIQGTYDLETAHLWEGKGRVAKTEYGLKVGCKTFTTLKRIPIPQVSLTQKAAFGILCAMESYHEPGWVQWAEDWLSGKDRTAGAAAEAAWAAAWAARAAAWAKEIDLVAIAQKAMQVQ